MIDKASKFDIVLIFGLILLGMVLLADYSRFKTQNTKHDKAYQPSNKCALTGLKIGKLGLL